MPGKKTNNQHNYGAREAWLKTKKQDRPKQVWGDYNGWLKIHIDEAVNIDFAAIENRVVKSLTT
jgi:hypothetical protein